MLPAGKTLSIAAPASYWYLKAFPIEAISAVVDYIVYMTYDLHGWCLSFSHFLSLFLAILVLRGCHADANPGKLFYDNGIMIIDGPALVVLRGTVSAPTST